VATRKPKNDARGQGGKKPKPVDPVEPTPAYLRIQIGRLLGTVHHVVDQYLTQVHTMGPAGCLDSLERINRVSGELENKAQELEALQLREGKIDGEGIEYLYDQPDPDQLRRLADAIEAAEKAKACESN
jgi:hypothetical protein